MKKTGWVAVLVFLSVLLAAVPVSAAEENPPAAGQEDVFVDLDLSEMSGTVVYAQVYNLMYDPSPWLGKTIRVAGYYSYFEDKDNIPGMVYHACVIPDATACCVQGLEFVWAGSHTWPDDYPDAGADIIVTGRLEMYEESGSKFLHLTDAELIVKEQEE